MEELLELHEALEQGRYDDAIALVEDMTAVAKKDITDKIGSYIRLLLMHLIKSQVEQRMTHSWRVSIKVALEEIREKNQREHSGGHYLDAAELHTVIERKYSIACERASLEAFEGKYSPREFARLVDAEAIKVQALEYILHGYPDDDSESED